jgi:hypothetical protein
MKVMYRPSVERLSVSSDFDGKLVTSWSLCDGTPCCVLLATSRELTSVPSAVIWSRKIGEVTPKLGSPASLFQTPGYAPSAVATVQPLVQPGGSSVWPGTSGSLTPP